MEITGRLVENAEVATTKGNKQVVNFTIADNYSYKAKGSTEIKKMVTYYNCSYWISAKVAEWLRKGTTILLTGRIGTNAYINGQGKAVANLTFNVREIKVLSFPPKPNEGAVVTIPEQATSGQNEPNDDLPF